MRHGKAMPAEQGQRDAERRLTEAGALALEAQLPRMLRLLRVHGRRGQIWVSPAVRACQTAELLAKALQGRGIELDGKIRRIDSLWRQNVDEFLAELQATDADLVFAVGHIPFVEEVVEELADATPDDIETIHRFRTFSRTLRSLLAFIKPWQNREENAEAQVILRDIVRHTSRLRELDVLERNARLNPNSSPGLLAFCKAEAARERAKVRKILKSKQVTRSFERAMELSKHIAWRKRVARDGLSAELIRARFDALVASVSADLAVVELSDAERTHDVRKRAKRARYVSEYCQDILGPDAVQIALGMMAHQDKLGDVCDARANIRLIDESLGRRLPKAAARELKSLRAENETFLYTTLKDADAQD